MTITVATLAAAGLSRSERAVAALLIRGLSTKEAAEVLGIPETTARRRMHSARARFGVTSNEALVAAIAALELP